uniref:Uncharacterized protein n=1 Tax=Kalanchoe fedtschenkoi TaxID=63787 RepID=A0A7N0V6L7_KALFE
MGRGRAPCCDKSRVTKGPWSPKEDLRLISFIQKYGHENWRALPKQAGLLRCGKSCRLRWINYLRPDLKRGNFTKEEEETIIRLQQSIGNKWSRIAAHLPGRTDNEIKNVWNTHLKKKLTSRAAVSVPKEDQVTKESPSSAIKFSFSSSAQVESNPNNNQKNEKYSQINLLPLDGSPTILAPNISTLANPVTELHDSESFNNFGNTSQHNDHLFNSSGINQLEQFTLWEDPNILESLLNTEEDPNWVLAPQNTQPDSTKDNFSGELSVVSEFDLWSTLKIDGIPAPAKPDDKEGNKIHTVEAPMGMNTAHEYITDKDIDSMFRYLETEPRLPEISVEMIEKPKQYQGVNLSHIIPAAATGSAVNETPGVDYFPVASISHLSLSKVLPEDQPTHLFGSKN